MDVAVPSDQNISLKEFQKLSKYKDLEIKVTKMYKLKCKKLYLQALFTYSHTLFINLANHRKTPASESLL